MNYNKEAFIQLLFQMRNEGYFTQDDVQEISKKLNKINKRIGE